MYYDKVIARYSYRGASIHIRIRYGYYVATTCFGGIHTIHGLCRTRYGACYKAQGVIDSYHMRGHDHGL